VILFFSERQLLAAVLKPDVSVLRHENVINRTLQRCADHFNAFAPQGHAYLAAPDRGGSRVRFLDRAKSVFEAEPQPNFCLKADAALAEWQQAQKNETNVPDDLEGYNPDLHHPHLTHLRRRPESCS